MTCPSSIARCWTSASMQSEQFSKIVIIYQKKHAFYNNFGNKQIFFDTIIDKNVKLFTRKEKIKIVLGLTGLDANEEF